MSWFLKKIERGMEVPRDRDDGLTRRSVVQMALLGMARLMGRARSVRGEERGTPRGAKQRGSSGGIRLGREPTGSEVWQVTTEEFDQSNIYCEVPYCSGDSRFFVYYRRNRDHTEFVVVELGTWKQHVLDRAAGMSGCAISRDGVFYYVKDGAEETLDLMRVNLSRGTPETIYELKGGPWTWSLGTVSADGRYYIRGKRLDNEWKRFGILLVDLKEGKEEIVDEDPYIWNAHPQFEPSESNQVMIQHNRGGTFEPNGKLVRSTGPEGATLYLLSAPDGKRTALQVGKPFTSPCTGHQAWIGDTREILLTVSARDKYAPEKGNLLGVREGEPARVVSKGYKFIHVGVSRCGRFFCCDDWQGACKLVIGSTQTGKTAVVCESKTSMGRRQNTHPHAYLTPDLKWIIFNSDRSGFPHIHAASVPEEMIKALART